LANLFPVCDRAPHDLSTSERSSVEAVSELHGWGVLVNSLEKVPWRLGLKILRSLATWGFEHNETQAAKITWYPLVNKHTYGKSPCLMGKFTINGNFQ
jgi:hypothetical protein